jgi:hypothetical protein
LLQHTRTVIDFWVAWRAATAKHERISCAVQGVCSFVQEWQVNLSHALPVLQCQLGSLLLLI